MRVRRLFVGLVVPALSTVGVAGAIRSDDAFLQRRGSTLLLDDRPIRVVSVNKHDLFAQFVMDIAMPLPPDRIGKPLFIGEIGLSETVGRDYASPQAFDLVRRQCNALRAARVPITLYWTFRDESGRIDPITGEYQLRFDRTSAVLKLLQEMD